MEPMNPMTGGGMPSAGMPQSATTPKKTSVVWLTAFGLAAIAVVAGWYYYTYYSSGPAAPTLGVPRSAVDTATNQLLQQGTSDDPAAIEQDLLSTDLTGLDKELSDIDTALTP